MIGWVIGGMWLAYSLGGPAYRKTVRAVLLTSHIRQLQKFRLGIGIIGLKAAGKDTAINKVFGLPARPDSEAGSTKKVEVHPLDGDREELTNARVANFPGMRDLRSAVNNEYFYMNEYEIFIHIIDYEIVQCPI